MLNVVWFKRDLRIYDAAPLAAANTYGPVLAIYVQEPSIWQSTELSRRHQVFVNESLLALQGELRKRGNELYVVTAEMEQVLETLIAYVGAFRLFAHEENGTTRTYARDRWVRRWMKNRGLPFLEFQHFGVVRRLANRNDFDEKWQIFMDEDFIPAPPFIHPAPHVPEMFSPDVTHLLYLQVAGETLLHRQQGGERLAHGTLKQFLQERFPQYLRHISSPHSAALSGSRLSPYLAWGNISMRYAVRSAITTYMELDDPWQKKALSAFISRLRWHCHFIQRLEDQATLDQMTMNPIFDSIRTTWNEEYFQRWAQGVTGIPLVDAGMRALHQTGWVNFRMRAILVSFVCNTLMLDWRKPAEYLAQLFLDYEPGIHFSQIQMQAGVTGFNTVRIYNPIKQAMEHDAQGKYVHRYVPELRNRPVPEVFEPWKSSCACDYPAPMIDVEKANVIARELLWSMKKNPLAQEQGIRNLMQHGSRNFEPRQPSTRKNHTSSKNNAVRKKKTQFPPHKAEQLNLDLDM